MPITEHTIDKLESIRKLGVKSADVFAVIIDSLNQSVIMHQQAMDALNQFTKDYPVLAPLLDQLDEFDVTDDKSVDLTQIKLQTAMNVIQSVLANDAVTFESQLLQQVLERAK